MRDILERQDAKKCIKAVKDGFMREAVATGISSKKREKAALKYQLVDRVVAELVNYKPEE